MQIELYFCLSNKMGAPLFRTSRWHAALTTPAPHIFLPPNQFFSEVLWRKWNTMKLLCSVQVGRCTFAWLFHPDPTVAGSETISLALELTHHALPHCFIFSFLICVFKSWEMEKNRNEACKNGENTRSFYIYVLSAFVTPDTGQEGKTRGKQTPCLDKTLVSIGGKLNRIHLGERQGQT